VTVGLGGGRRAAGPTITGIPLGTTCTVVENTASLPAGTVVTYVPAGASSPPGVTIEGETGVVVAIVNDFSGIEVQTGSIRVLKVVEATGPGIVLPDSYLAFITCDDGTEAEVTLPGAGGEGTPIVTATAGALCILNEDAATLPAGWTVTYSVGGGPASSTPPLFTVIANQTIEVTITNDPVATTTTTTTTPATSTTAPATSSTTSGASSGGGLLPATGMGGLAALVVLASALASAGVLIVVRAGGSRRSG
jgi:Domain of unknown function (DUF5979)